MQLAVLEARSKGWGRIGQAPKGRSQSAPRGVPRSRVAPASRPAVITVSTAVLLLTVNLRGNFGLCMIQSTSCQGVCHAVTIRTKTMQQHVAHLLWKDAVVGL